MELEDYWTTRSLPVLKWALAHEGLHGARLGTISEELGLSPEEVIAELERLASDGLMIYEPHREFGPVENWLVGDIRVTGEGARTLGVWPSANELLAAVDRAAQQATDPRERSRWTSLGAAIREIGLPVLTQTIEGYVKQKMGLPP